MAYQPIQWRELLKMLGGGAAPLLLAIFLCTDLREAMAEVIHPGTQDVQAEVVVENGQFKLITQALTPESPYVFKQQPNTHYAKTTGGGLFNDAVEWQLDSESAVKVAFTSVAGMSHASAFIPESWRPMLSGRMWVKPSGGGGSGTPKPPPEEKDWTANVKSCVAYLEVDNINTDGKQALSGGSTVNLGNPTGPGAWEKNPINRWPAANAERKHPFIYIKKTPEMPKMVAHVKGAPAGAKVEWSVKVDYKREVADPTRYQLEDHSKHLVYTLETHNTVDNPADQMDWNVAAALANHPGQGNPLEQMQAQTSGFWGGEAEFKWKVLGGNNAILDEGTLSFSIRGENPTWQAVGTEIQTQIGGKPGQWAQLADNGTTISRAILALFIHESNGKTDGEQFNWAVKKANRTPSVGNSTHQPNHSSDGRGIGLTQITWVGAHDWWNPDRTVDGKPAPGQDHTDGGNLYGRTLPMVTWHWPSNLGAGLALIEGEKIQKAIDRMALETGPLPIPPQNTGLAGVTVGDGAATLSAKLATALKYYNGGMKHPAVWWNARANGGGGAWEYNSATKNPKVPNYLDRVLKDGWNKAVQLIP